MGEERRASERVSRSGGPAKATNAPSLGEAPGEYTGFGEYKRHPKPRQIVRLRKGMGALGWGQKFPPRKFPMPKLPDSSAAAVKAREALTKIYKASKPKDAPAAPPKPRIAKGR